MLVVKHDDNGAAYQRQIGATEAVRRCLDRVEIGSPLLYPF